MSPCLEQRPSPAGCRDEGTGERGTQSATSSRLGSGGAFDPTAKRMHASALVPRTEAAGFGLRPDAHGLPCQRKDSDVMRR